SEATSRFIPLGIGKSVAIDLPADIKDVLVADPKIANAVIRSSRRVYMIGVAVGQTNIFFFDSEGKQIAGFDIAVKRDLNGVRAALKQAIPDADLRIEGIGDGVMLTGNAANPQESQQAYDLATRLVGDGNKVVNGIAVRGRDQVMLKVTVAEVRRDVIKQLGIDLSGTLNYGTAVVNFNTSNPFSANGGPLRESLVTRKVPSRNATLRGTARDGAGRHHSDLGRAEPDGNHWRNRDIHCGRRISDPERTVLRHHAVASVVSASDHFQKIRREPGVHAGRAERRSYQPEGH